MTDGTVKTYEMLWDCEYCGAVKLLGKTHRHCPECGAAQNPERRYFPEESEKVAVEDHQYVGADLRCPACKAPNSEIAKFCAECGSPIEKGAQVALKQDPAASPPVPASAPKKSGGVKAWPFGVGGIGLSLIIAVCAASFWTKTVAITTAGHTWVRE